MITFLVILLFIAAVVGLIVTGLLIALVGIVFLWGYNRQRKKLCQELHAAYQFPWPDDATKCQDAIQAFLRKAERNIAVPSDEMKIWESPDSSSSDINFFIRMCHALGCEIVIRRVADHDIEINPDDPRFEKVREYIDL